MWRSTSSARQARTAIHRSRICRFVIDVAGPVEVAVFWTAAPGAAQQPVSAGSRRVYRKLLAGAALERTASKAARARHPA